VIIEWAPMKSSIYCRNGCSRWSPSPGKPAHIPGNSPGGHSCSSRTYPVSHHRCCKHIQDRYGSAYVILSIHPAYSTPVSFPIIAAGEEEASSGQGKHPTSLVPFIPWIIRLTYTYYSPYQSTLSIYPLIRIIKKAKGMSTRVDNSLAYFLARPVRFERTTNRFEACDSIQLSYGRKGEKRKNGVSEGN
jgi:hypothetical protein